MKKDNYSELPEVKYGFLSQQNGIFIDLPVKAISVNDWKKMHWRTVANLRARYKAIIDVVVLDLVDNGILRMADVGLVVPNQIFVNTLKVCWILSFNQKRSRDCGNYVQKILMDAIVDTGIIKDNN